MCCNRKEYLTFAFPVLITLFALSCNSRKIKQPMFEALTSEKTGLDFNNKLTYTQNFNLFTYMYFYNGAGLAAGDLNNDGLIDLFFCANQTENKLYLNSGKLKFRDVTTEAKIPEDGAWSTGVSLVDINNDGLLDIYVCRVSKYLGLKGANQFLICQGIDKNGVPFYLDKAAEYGLNFSGLSSQAAFLDYDGDGDLDMYLLNHSIHQNTNFADRKSFDGTYSELSGDRFFRNDGKTFTDVTRQTNINSTAIGYGLGIVVSDINLDGFPDIYIGNDFHENDYLYINQRDGTFKEELNDHILHTSRYTMGVDATDVTNDGFPEIISVDMLASDPYILKRSLGDDEYDLFNQKLSFGYNHQYSRNNLQLNRRNGFFSETALYSGVAATDWSWAPLWVDFDNDGLKDLFISNGIPKRLNDMDYINYVSNRQVQEKIANNKVEETDLSLMDKFPQIKIPNIFYKNVGNLIFEDLDSTIENNPKTYSNGAVYADLDNDGDLDIIVNNIDETAIIYENKSNQNDHGSYLDVRLNGPGTNVDALGSKLYVFSKGNIYSSEKSPVHGFLSSMEIPIHIGLHHIQADSIFLVWPDNSYQRIADSTRGEAVFSYRPGLPKFDYSKIAAFQKLESRRVVDITTQEKLSFRHKENPFPEFDREPLIPHMLSTEGPGLAVADINGDGLDDIFIGSSKGEKPGIFIQDASGKFSVTSQPALDADSIYEDVDACWIDVDNDKDIDLIVVSGGNEFYGQDDHLMPRVYLNDGHLHFTKKKDAFANLFQTFSCIAAADINGDAFIDLFVGGRDVPWHYGEIPRSYLLKNDGHGKFEDVTSKYSAELMKVGMVTDAVWCDLDKDGKQDLIVCSEWGKIEAFMNSASGFNKVDLSEKSGWWNFILPVDVDNDGDLDFIAGNLGLNSRLKASVKEPVKLYYNDFDDNGKSDQLLTYYVNGREIPFANKMELELQLPFLKKKFLYAEDFAKASLTDLFPSEKLAKAQVLTANYFPNAVLLNEHGRFVLKELPWEAQLTTYRDASVVDANEDGLPDILLAGNFDANNIQMGRYDADPGTILINKGSGNFVCENLNGLVFKSQTRHVRKIKIANRKDGFVLANNNDSVRLIQFLR